MIIGIGLDIVEHDVTRFLNWETDFDLQQRYFSVEELRLYHEKKALKFLTGRFAAKEAVLKCLGVGMQDGIALTDIHILQHNSGKPFIELTGEVERLSDDKLIVAWHVSITHADNSSFAFVIAEG